MDSGEERLPGEDTVDQAREQDARHRIVFESKTWTSIFPWMVPLTLVLAQSCGLASGLAIRALSKRALLCYLYALP